MNYLYNGEIGPAIPEPPTSYPNLVIMMSFSRTWLWVYALDRKMTRRKGGALGTADNILDCSPFTFYSCKLRDDDGKVLENASWGRIESASSVGGEIVWANYDVYNTDGTLYLAASDPIPVSSFTPDPISMTMCWLVGRRIAGQRGKRTPIAYLYNGVRLPKLPEWDREMYPYAIIYRNPYEETLESVELKLLSHWPVDIDVFGDTILRYYVGDVQYRVSLADDGSVAYWKDPIILGYDGLHTLESVVWTSHDILYKDGTVAVAASEPIPVYES